LLAAAAVAAAFFAFSPTTYRGVAEPGVIAGAGMAVAILLALTLLPATLALFGAPGSTAEQGLRQLAGADRLVRRVRWPILVLTACATALSMAALPMLRVNFDPMRLRSPRTEAMSTYLELARSADTTPNTLNVLRPNLAAADEIARRLDALPEVAEAITASALAPGEQDAKLTLIRDAQMLLDPTLNPFDVAPAPSESTGFSTSR
jgi:uncharacterized membrane protein YdfJ with MMPL/SSD domain